MGRAKTAVALLSTAVLLLAGCSAAAGKTSGHASPRVTMGRLAWHTCSVPEAGPMQCASLQVPLDYSHTSGRKITLALSMVPATVPLSQQLGDLLVNPGGPGGSGRALAADVAFGLDHTVASRYNIIGFDPRGVGASVPALQCDHGFFAGVRPDYIPANAAAEQVLISRAKAYADHCEQRFGWLLPFMTSVDVARDMDSIRAALGVPKISYFGYSYGTYLGQVYATLFPQRVRRMVLDSTVNPAGAWYADNIDQDYAFQGRMEAFFSWVASHASTYGLGGSRTAVQRTWYQVRADLGSHPITGPGGPMIGPDEYDDTFLQGGYSNSLWPQLANALSQFVHHRTTALMVADFKSLGLQNENEFAVYNAVECSDVNWPRSWAKWNSDTERVYKTAPFEAWDNAWFNAACAFWPVRGPAQPMRIGAPGLPGILMIQGTLDAATPYAGAQVAHKDLPTARMVVVEGGGNHGQSLSQPPNTCVNGYLDRYLADGSLPTHPGLVNAACAALPPPSPNG